MVHAGYPWWQVLYHIAKEAAAVRPWGAHRSCGVNAYAMTPVGWGSDLILGVTRWGCKSWVSSRLEIPGNGWDWMRTPNGNHAMMLKNQGMPAQLQYLQGCDRQVQAKERKPREKWGSWSQGTTVAGEHGRALRHGSMGPCLATLGAWKIPAISAVEARCFTHTVIFQLHSPGAYLLEGKLINHHRPALVK